MKSVEPELIDQTIVGVSSCVMTAISTTKKTNTTKKLNGVNAMTKTKVKRIKIERNKPHENLHDLFPDADTDLDHKPRLYINTFVEYPPDRF